MTTKKNNESKNNVMNNTKAAAQGKAKAGKPMSHKKQVDNDFGSLIQVTESHHRQPLFWIHQMNKDGFWEQPFQQTDGTIKVTKLNCSAIKAALLHCGAKDGKFDMKYLPTIKVGSKNIIVKQSLCTAAGLSDAEREAVLDFMADGGHDEFLKYDGTGFAIREGLLYRITQVVKFDDEVIAKLTKQYARHLAVLADNRDSEAKAAERRQRKAEKRADKVAKDAAKQAQAKEDAIAILVKQGVISEEQAAAMRALKDAQ